MKKLLFLLAITFTINVLSQCPTIDVVLQSQADIDAFPIANPGCTNLTVNLSIGRLDFIASDISDLSPLSGLNTIGGFLYIHDNPNLSNFSGLDNISSVTTGIYIDNNSGLLDFSGLSGLTSVGYVDIRNNVNLMTLSALSPNLSNMTDYLSIYNNANLTGFTGLDNITTISTQIYVGFNNSLANFAGLNSLTSVGNYVWVESNNNLTSFTGLNSLGSIIGNMLVDNNILLTDFTGLNTLTSINGYLFIEDNTALTDFTGLNNLGSVGTFLRVINNAAILNLNGFDSLSSLGTYFHVGNNTAMTTLNGVETLATIGTNIEIVGGMPNLTDISGISNIDYTTITGLFITDNTSLAVCEELNICTYLDNGGAASISGNATGCATVAEVNTACISVLGVDEYSLENKLSIYPNPVKDRLNIKLVQGEEIEKILIYSTLGKLVKEYEVINNSINVKNLKSGIYILKVITKNTILTEKIVKT
ncbi:MAG: T9SS type A sorting domain-containing protein [Flavobacteriaceae bacterium]|nr:T9SS type A sorting domain-containing protein [Flavobacteriaceae bacterium]